VLGLILHWHLLAAAQGHSVHVRAEVDATCWHSKDGTIHQKKEFLILRMDL